MIRLVKQVNLSRGRDLTGLGKIKVRMFLQGWVAGWLGGLRKGKYCLTESQLFLERAHVIFECSVNKISR